MMHKYTTSRLRLSADARSSPDEYLHTDTKKRPREILFFKHTRLPCLKVPSSHPSHHRRTEQGEFHATTSSSSASHLESRAVLATRPLAPFKHHHGLGIVKKVATETVDDRHVGRRPGGPPSCPLLLLGVSHPRLAEQGALLCRLQVGLVKILLPTARKRPAGSRLPLYRPARRADKP